MAAPFAAQSPKPEPAKETEKTGRYLFTESYYPIKRLNFTKEAPFQVIYRNKQFADRSYKFMRKKLFVFNQLPFIGYSVSYLFFFDLFYWPHYVALAGLCLFGLRSSRKNYGLMANMVGEFSINESGDQFRLTLPYSYFNHFLNEDLENNYQLITFTVGLDDITDIVLEEQYLSQLRERAEDEEKRREQAESGSAKPEPKQVIQDPNAQQQPLIDPADLQDSVLINIRKKVKVMKDEKVLTQTFYLDLEQNQLPGFNDYFVALAKKRRLIMRRPRAEQEQQKEPAKPQNEQQQQKAKPQKEQEPVPEQQESKP